MYLTCSGTSSSDPNGVAIIQGQAGWVEDQRRDSTLEVAMSAIEQFLAYNFDRDPNFQVSFTRDYPRSLNNRSHTEWPCYTLQECTAYPRCRQSHRASKSLLFLKVRIMGVSLQFVQFSHKNQRKTGMNVSWDEVQAHLATTKDANRDRKGDELRTSSATQPNAHEPQQLSIAEVTRLIESGQIHLIPHTETIPEHLNVRHPFVSVSVFQNMPITYPHWRSLRLLGSTTQ